MSALKYLSEPHEQPELDFGAPRIVSAETFMRLATPDDLATPSPVAAIQADLESQLAQLAAPGRWPVGGMVLALLAAGAILWWAIIGGVLALLHGG